MAVLFILPNGSELYRVTCVASAILSLNIIPKRCDVLKMPKEEYIPPSLIEF